MELKITHLILVVRGTLKVRGPSRKFCIMLDFSVKIDWQGVGFVPLESLVTLFLL